MATTLAWLPDWRDPSAYRFERLDRPGFAWEWLRRDPVYCAAFARATTVGAGSAGPAVVAAIPIVGDCDPARWGLVAFEDPFSASPVARPMWRSDHDGMVLQADAVPCDAADPDAVLFERWGELATLVRGEGVEHLLLTDGWRRVRIDICSGSFCVQPVCLHWHLVGLRSAAGGVIALRRILSITHSGKFANRLWPRDPRARRWTIALRAHDALAADATQRDIAGLLAGEDDAGDRWRVRDPSLRLRAQRLTALARSLGGTQFARRYLENRAS